MDRIGKKEREGTKSVSCSQMSRLPLYSNVLFIWPLVFLSSHLPFNPQNYFPASALLSFTASCRMIFLVDFFFFFFECIPWKQRGVPGRNAYTVAQKAKNGGIEEEKKIANREMALDQRPKKGELS